MTKNQEYIADKFDKITKGEIQDNLYDTYINNGGGAD